MDEINFLQLQQLKQQLNTLEVGVAKTDLSNVEDTVFKEKAESAGISSALDFMITLGTTWTGDTAPFTQTIAVEGILATDEPIVDIELSDDYDTMIAQLEDYANIIKLETAENSVTVYFNDIPTETLTLRLKVIR